MPGNWYVFMNHLCGQRVNSDAFNRKSHVIFQIVYYLLHNGSKKLCYMSALHKMYS